ncbi:MAG: AgmX/PglI C-terminal domain-containing protein [Pseudomonadota bacterium]|nr:AgmX/PglI C-terminal domain-containing protein [Pseudomonadota bacterium]
MLLALALSASAANLPAPLVTYDRVVASVTTAMNAALPRLAACKAQPGDRLVFKVDLVADAKVTTLSLAGAASSPVSAPCHEKVVSDVFKAQRLTIGREAAIVLENAPGAPKLDGDVALFGALGKDAIEAGVRSRMDGVAQCYVNALPDAPGLAGEVVVSFTVLPSGHVIAPMLKKTTLWNPPTEACVLDQVRFATFQEPAGGGIVRVTYPFTFKPPEE